jgi:uncharacterized protein YoxC
MISIKNYYDSSNLVNNNKVPLPYKGLYEDLFNFNGIVIETFTNVTDTLHIDFLNSINSLSDINSTPIITETYTINPNSPKTIIIQPRLRYYRMRITTPLYNSVTDNRKYILRLINTNTLPNKIYGSENMPIVTDSLGNLLLPSLETLIEETNLFLTQIHNDVSGLDSRLVTIHNDVSGLDSRLVTIHNDVSGLDSRLVTIHNDVSGLDSRLVTIHNDVSGITTSFNQIHNDVSGLDSRLVTIHNDVSGITTSFNQIHNDVSGITTSFNQIHNDVSGFSNLQFDSSKNLLISEMSNFTVNTAQNKTKSQFVNILADNGGIVLNGTDGTRDFIYGPSDASGAFYVFNSIQNNIILSSSSASDNSSYSILISGLDNTYSIISETLQLNGTSQVTSSNQYFRLNSLELITAPSNGLTFVNPLNGDITITDASSNIFGIIDKKSGKRCAGVYTVPDGYKLLITKLEFSEETNQGATIFLYTRNAASTNKRFNLLAKYYFSNEKREINRESNPYIINEKTDLLLRIKTDGNAYCNISAILSI